MKKTSTLLSGIVFLLAILSTGGCCTKQEIISGTERGAVIIYLKAMDIHGSKHLLLFDTNNDANIDSLKTDVKAGGKVVWRLGHNSGISTIDKIFPNSAKSKIFEQGTVKNGNIVILDIPADVISGTVDEYTITFTLEDSTKVTIDPYLRIPE